MNGSKSRKFIGPRDQGLIRLKMVIKIQKKFHRKASQRRQKNLIQGIMDTHGHWVEDKEGVAV